MEKIPFLLIIASEILSNSFILLFLAKYLIVTKNPLKPLVNDFVLITSQIARDG